MNLNETHNPQARSWIEVSPDCHFPIQNLPFCTYASDRAPHGSIAVRIGDQLVDLYELCHAGLLQGGDDHFTCDFQEVLEEGGRTSLREIRRQLFQLLSADSTELRDNADLRKKAVCPVDQAEILLPMTINAFVDFYSGIHHASNVGKMFRPDQPSLLPNYRHLPIGYNGRASSVIPSGEPIYRPKGQMKSPNSDLPEFGPTRELDFELEMGFFTGKSSEFGHPIPIGECEDHIFGVVIVNDWSARDVQRWEYQPLGPFLAKSFGTSISPYVVTLDALEPWRIDGQKQEPDVLPHLRNPGPSHFDIQLEVSLQSPTMTKPQVISRSNTKYLYWSFAQQLAHQSSNGTPIEAADLYASGTISGEAPDNFGSMLELCWKGTKPITLTETGETRTFIADGDTLTMTAWCQGEGYRVGFGEVATQVLPAV
ncbi:MAG TPA: fumarylacetoacetase [Fimbriimonadaceae bacterium]|nr:fumarylacetoacetase [Fimbriimonadaceae bacterium]